MSFLLILVCLFLVFSISSNKINSISSGIFLSSKSRHLQMFCQIKLFWSTLQLYRTIFFLAQLSMAASNHLINKCDQKIRQVKNQIIERQIGRKIKAPRLVKFLSCFFRWLECVILGELQVLNALQHRFKPFSGTT